MDQVQELICHLLQAFEENAGVNHQFAPDFRTKRRNELPLYSLVLGVVSDIIPKYHEYMTYCSTGLERTTLLLHRVWSDFIVVKKQFMLNHSRGSGEDVSFTREGLEQMPLLPQMVWSTCPFWFESLEWCVYLCLSYSMHEQFWSECVQVKGPFAPDIWTKCWSVYVICSRHVGHTLEWIGRLLLTCGPNAEVDMSVAPDIRTTCSCGYVSCSRHSDQLQERRVN